MNVREKGRVCVNVYVVITWDHREFLCVCVNVSKKGKVCMMCM